MHVFVCIKQVPDTETKIRIKPDGSGIDEAGIKWVINPYDEFAIEEALKIKDRAPDTRVTVMSLGPKARTVDALRTALAMGADDGIVIDESNWVDNFTTAKALAEAIKTEGSPSFVFTGKMAIDDQMGAVSQYLAEFLQIPHSTGVVKFSTENSLTTVEREIEGGAREILELTGPCLIACTKGLNTPRYASLPGIMKAKKKPIKELTLSALNVVSAAKIRLSDYKLPDEKPKGQILSGDPAEQAKQLVNLLHEQAKVI